MAHTNTKEKFSAMYRSVVYGCLQDLNTFARDSLEYVEGQGFCVDAGDELRLRLDDVPEDRLQVAVIRNIDSSRHLHNIVALAKMVLQLCMRKECGGLTPDSAPVHTWYVALPSGENMTIERFLDSCTCWVQDPHKDMESGYTLKRTAGMFESKYKQFDELFIGTQNPEQRVGRLLPPTVYTLSLIHISEPTRPRLI
eukprot:1870972-Rhodomonas_salina.1